ncbi:MULTISPECIES: plasmid replication/partition related protein [unclassified Acidovorax]|uniref:plasmid replication/partition related protein n=1 Tax=unclassified Acidovorax TaxID=2684926 RepID=UPI001C469BAA|nr:MULTISPECIES: plasmid replication/partition related protein [unclassified Acidovorax]MBV7431606.1 plasmid replication/partition related protein [Acidovorax sp. sif0732]MBV7452748.1 plasmid replication/partition related protein [Acidovorax sp. sif0715]
MNIVVNEELKAYIEPLTPDEHEALERSILAEGCRDALVLWGDVLVDGHNRYGICQKHGLPFQTVQNPRFQSMEDVHLWMIDQHLGRRSVSDFQRGVLALRKREIMAERKARAPEPSESPDTLAADAPAAPEATAALPAPDPLASREAIARAARLSSSQVVMIEKIQKQAAPELVAAVKSGTISINAAAAVSTLPAEEQVAAVAAGKDELKQAAKRVRELNKRKPRDEARSEEEEKEEKAAPQPGTGAEGSADELQALRHRVAELTAENTELRRQLAQLRADQPAHSAPF